MMELPELPEPLPTMKEWPFGAPWFTADQMQTYAAAAVEAERAACAEACEAEAQLWKGEQDITDFRLCAAVIRARSAPRTQEG